MTFEALPQEPDTLRGNYQLSGDPIPFEDLLWQTIQNDRKYSLDSVQKIAARIRPDAQRGSMQLTEPLSIKEMQESRVMDSLVFLLSNSGLNEFDEIGQPTNNTALTRIGFIKTNARTAVQFELEEPALSERPRRTIELEVFPRFARNCRWTDEDDVKRYSEIVVDPIDPECISVANLYAAAVQEASILIEK